MGAVSPVSFADDAFMQKVEQRIVIPSIEGLKEESSYTVSPIIMNGDTLGNVVIFSINENITDIEVKLASIASNFLANHIEE